MVNSASVPAAPAIGPPPTGTTKDTGAATAWAKLRRLGASLAPLSPGLLAGAFTFIRSDHYLHDRALEAVILGGIIQVGLAFAYMVMAASLRTLADVPLGDMENTEWLRGLLTACLLAVEQGILALVAYLALLAGSFFLVVTSKAHAALRWAVLASLWVLAVNGLADDPLYGGRGTPLLFLLPGLAVACGRYLPRGQPFLTAGGQARKLRLGTTALLIIIAVSYLGYKLVSTRLGAWYANLGAVQMAQVELADFPSGEWEDGSILPALAPAEDLFNQALQREAGNFTAATAWG